MRFCYALVKQVFFYITKFELPCWYVQITFTLSEVLTGRCFHSAFFICTAESAIFSHQIRTGRCFYSAFFICGKPLLYCWQNIGQTDLMYVCKHLVSTGCFFCYLCVTVMICRYNGQLYNR